MEEQADRLQESRGEGETGSTKSLDQMTPVVDALPADDWGHGELLATEVRPAAERQLVRLLDMRLMPMVVLIYIMNFIDVSVIALLVHSKESISSSAYSDHCGSFEGSRVRSASDRSVGLLSRHSSLFS